MSQTKIKRKPMWRARVAVIVPTNRPVEIHWYRALEAVLDRARSENIASFMVETVGKSAVHQARNAPLAALIKSGQPFSHVLYIDDDIMAPPDALVKMVGHGVDIVAALCTTRNDPPIPTCRVKVDGQWEYLYGWKDGLTEVDGIGTGMMLLTLDAIQKVAGVYFTCAVEKDVWGLSEARAKEIGARRLEHFDKTGDAWWFRFMDLDGVAESGEDIAFCVKAKQYAGLKVHMDSSIQPVHLGIYPYGIKDFLPFREKMLQGASVKQQAVGADGSLSRKVKVVE